jgi:hypothetical protein
MVYTALFEAALTARVTLNGMSRGDFRERERSKALLEKRRDAFITRSLCMELTSQSQIPRIIILLSSIPQHSTPSDFLDFYYPPNPTNSIFSASEHYREGGDL